MEILSVFAVLLLSMGVGAGLVARAYADGDVGGETAVKIKDGDPAATVALVTVERPALVTAVQAQIKVLTKAEPGTLIGTVITTLSQNGRVIATSEPSRIVSSGDLKLLPVETTYSTAAPVGEGQLTIDMTYTAIGDPNIKDKGIIVENTVPVFKPLPR